MHNVTETEAQAEKLAAGTPEDPAHIDHPAPENDLYDNMPCTD